jgi:hypothetical protein
MNRQDRRIDSHRHTRIGVGVVVRLPAGRPVDPLKIIDGLPKRQIAGLRSAAAPSIVPRDDPDGLPGHGRYGAAY